MTCEFCAHPAANHDEGGCHYLLLDEPSADFLARFGIDPCACAVMVWQGQGVASPRHAKAAPGRLAGGFIRSL